MGDQPLVTLKGITKSFGAVQSLRGVDLTLAPGEVLGLVGDNGAGKSTLMKVLAGAVQHDAGQITIDGREVRFASPADARRERIGIVYQDLALCDTLDVAPCTRRPPRRCRTCTSGSSRPTRRSGTCPAGSGRPWRSPAPCRSSRGC
jgi:ABC-type sugar transport system ATPase subunit